MRETPSALRIVRVRCAKDRLRQVGRGLRTTALRVVKLLTSPVLVSHEKYLIESDLAVVAKQLKY